MAKQCEHVKNDKQCQAYAITDSDFCFAHDPANAKKRAEARKKGGYNRRVIKNTENAHSPIKSIKDINTILESSINEACSLESSLSKLRVVGYLCQIAIKGQELGSLEERVNTAEERIEKMEAKDESKSTNTQNFEKFTKGR